MASPQEVLAQLRSIPYPGFSRDIVSFGVVKDIAIDSEGVTIIVAPTTDDREIIRQICERIDETVTAMNVGQVRIRITAPPQRAGAAAAPAHPRGPMPIPGIKHIIAVASGKGGVGKSTVATNLAVALSERFGRIGLLDADVYGPSIPVMLGIRERPRSTENKRLVPVTAHGLTVISMGLFLGEHAPAIWRGPMLTKLLGEFFRNVEWGELDCLVLDLPPGTGDVQLTITQQIALTGGLIVTTPQDVALLDVKRGIAMFQQVKAPVLGVVENMSYHLCSQCGERAEIFGHGGGARMAEQMDVPFLGEIPLYREVRTAADEGTPIVLSQPDHAASRALRAIADRVAARLADAPADTQAPLAS
jgi:ATP-binding protein involved in chromosome partitioning